MKKLPRKWPFSHHFWGGLLTLIHTRQFRPKPKELSAFWCQANDDASQTMLMDNYGFRNFQFSAPGDSTWYAWNLRWCTGEQKCFHHQDICSNVRHDAMASSLKTNICVSRSKEKESSSNIFCSSFTKVDRCRNSSELTEHRNAEYHVQLTRFVCLIIAYKVLIRIKSKAYWTIIYLFKGLERMEKLIFAHYACKVSLELVNDLDHYLFKNVLGLAKLASIRFTPIVS